MSKGILTQNGVHLNEHEYKTIKTLLNNGYDVELIPPSQVKGIHLPDIYMNSVAWEIKSPEGKGKNTILHNLQSAKKQSHNVIIDLRRCGLSESVAIKELKNLFDRSKSLRRMLVITKSEEILDLQEV